MSWLNEVRLNSLNRRGRTGASHPAAARAADPDMLSKKGVLRRTVTRILERKL